MGERERGRGHVVAVQTLSLPLHGVSVVALSSCHHRLVSLLACFARPLFFFFFFQIKTPSTAVGVMQAVSVVKKIKKRGFKSRKNVENI